MKTLTATEDSVSSLLEFASNNDVQGFELLLDKVGASSINKVGIWYGRQYGSKQIVRDHKTSLMVASTFGSIDVMKLILSYQEADVNLACGVSKMTALHCAAFGGFVNVVDAVRLLIEAGADVNCVDANGNRPVDVIVVPPMLQSMKAVLEELLSDNASDIGSIGEFSVSVSVNSSSSGLLENGMTLPYSPSVSPPSPVVDLKFTKKKEYPVDPSLPGIKNGIYASDEFRMYSFKVRLCSRAYSHDWTECPFVHPGENARRRDPRKFHYTCVPCAEFKIGLCRREDMCEFAHGVFETWLHPDLYRTRFCKDRTSCNRRVCFFAHTAEELRPVNPSTGSAVSSPRSSGSALNVMDITAAMNLLAGSPGSVSSMSPSHFAQPMSAHGNGMLFSSVALAQQNVPTLHIPGTNFQSSRLRRAPTPSNLKELFSAEVLSSPQYSDQSMTSVFSPSRKPAAMNHFNQLQNMLLPINSNMLSPKYVEHPMLQASFGVPFSGTMSPRSIESISPMSPLMSPFAQHEKQQQHLRSISSRDLGSNIPASVVGSPTNPRSKWGSPNGKVDWSINRDELSHQMRCSSSFEPKIIAEEPDLSWVQSLVKDSSPEMVKEKFASSGPIASTDGLNSNSQIEPIHPSVSGAWLEQLKLDQLVV